MCESLVCSLQPSSGRLEFEEGSRDQRRVPRLQVAMGRASEPVGRCGPGSQAVVYGIPRLLSLKASTSGSQACLSPIIDRFF